MTKFKQEIIELMLNDPRLFALICEAKAVKPSNLGIVIRRNGNSINQYGIVKIVADYLGRDPDELIEEKHIAGVKVG